jgi:hypothetical protein
MKRGNTFLRNPCRMSDGPLRPPDRHFLYVVAVDGRLAVKRSTAKKWGHPKDGPTKIWIGRLSEISSWMARQEPRQARRLAEPAEHRPRC